MYEVEAKAPFKKSDYARLKREILKVARFVKKTAKKDFYFPGFKTLMIRLRVEGERGMMTIKAKSRAGGVESNEEREWEVKDPPAFLRFMKKAGLPLTLKKQKFSEVFSKGPFSIELNRVTGLGYYLEIETMVKSKSSAKAARKKLLLLFRHFGFNPSDLENKYYLELLRKKNH
ncbi:class IV adenylate cyclase [Candidatus Peregrinibacteria bacterium]|nr:class IV adenylate cyclase [Candidatus Peregrinibacteria bacterium]